MIFSHCIVQFCEFGFHCPFQSELSVDKVNSMLLIMHQFYVGYLELLYCLIMSLSLLSLDSVENKKELPVKATALAKTPPISIAMLAILKTLMCSGRIFCLMRYCLVISDAAMMETSFPVTSRSNFWMLGGAIFSIFLLNIE